MKEPELYDEQLDFTEAAWWALAVLVVGLVWTGLMIALFSLIS